MSYQLGNIKFSNLFGPVSLVDNNGVDIAEHSNIMNKPTLEPVGFKARVIDMSFKIHASHGVNINNFINRLYSAMNNFEVLPLLRNDGEVIGDFLIEEVNIGVSKDLPDGTPLEREIDLSLKEYFLGEFDPPVNGIAISGTDSPLVDPIATPQGDSMSAAVDVASTLSDSNDLHAKMSVLDAAYIFRPQVEKIIERVNLVVNGINSVKSKINADPNSQIYQATRLLNSTADSMLLLSNDILVRGNDLLDAIDNNDPSGISTNVNLLVMDAVSLDTLNSDFSVNAKELNKLVLNGG